MPRKAPTPPAPAEKSRSRGALRYAALLRGVSPMNLAMADLRACLEAEGFEDVKTVLSSGNVVFSTRKTSEPALERALLAAMQRHLGRTFPVFVRSVDALRALLESDPYRELQLPAGAKRIVTFLREPPPKRLALPIERDGAQISVVRGHEALGAYVPRPGDPAFMRLLEKTFGADITTRTWDSVAKIAR